MSDASYDVVVVGLGGMGSAAAAHLAGRGQRVLGLEQFTPAHDRGASHGESRIIRQAYFEDPAYVPLLLRSHELYEDLDRERPGILTPTGGLMMGAPDSAVVAGSLRSARQWDLPHELLDATALRRRFPAFRVDDDTVALFETRAGFTRPEETVRCHLDRAGRLGADLRFGERVLEWTARASGDGVEVRTDRGRYTAGQLVLAPGAWAPGLVPSLDPHLVVERQLLFWFRPRGGVADLRAPALPVFVWEDPDGMQLYGFPAYGSADDGVKVAFFRNAAGRADPDALDREVHDHEVRQMDDYLAGRLPRLTGGFRRGLSCMYTTTPDENFLIDRHPEHPQVVVCAGFSGHGFKFVPVVGEIVADLVVDGGTHHDIALFSLARLAAPLAGAPG